MKKKKCLIIKLSSLGDCLASTPFFTLVHNNGYEVHHAVMEHCFETTQHHPFIAKHIILPLIPSSFIKNLFFCITLIFHLIKERYDVVILAHRHLLLASLIRLFHMKSLYTYTSLLSILMTKTVPFDMTTNRTLLEFNLYKLFLPNLQPPVSLEYIPQSYTFPLPSRFIVCHPGGGENFHACMPHKRVSEALYITLLNALNTPVIFVGKGKDDESITHRIMYHLTIPYTSYVSQLSWDQSAYVIQQSLFFIGNDSALTYLASATHIPLLAFYTVTSAQSFLPLGQHSHSLSANISCSPCYNHSHDSLAYTCNNPRCKYTFDVQEAITIVQRYL